jgi:hypothetical protein
VVEVSPAAHAGRWLLVDEPRVDGSTTVVADWSALSRVDGLTIVIEDGSALSPAARCRRLGVVEVSPAAHAGRRLLVDEPRVDGSTTVVADWSAL